MLPKYPCTVCSKPCKMNQKAIECNICSKWVHRKCTALTDTQFNDLGSSDMPYFCQPCINTVLPFHDLPNIYTDLFNSSTSQVENKLKPQTALSTNQPISYPHLINNNNDYKSGFRILHANVISIFKNLAKLESLLLQSQLTPELIGISETKLKDDIQY